jgi:hypothetical protein
VSSLAAQGVRRGLSVLVGCVVFLLPSLAAACAVCMSNDQEDTRLAFILTTAFMTFMPLTVLFLAIRWFVRRAKVHDLDQDEIRVAHAHAHAHKARALAATPNRL